MRIVWSADARRDLERVHDFLAPKNRPAADRTVMLLMRAPLRLIELPRMGARVETFPDQDVRRIVIAHDYEIRYEIIGSMILVLRIFHAREDR